MTRTIGAKNREPREQAKDLLIEQQREQLQEAGRRVREAEALAAEAAARAEKAERKLKRALANK